MNKLIVNGGTWFVLSMDGNQLRVVDADGIQYTDIYTVVKFISHTLPEEGVGGQRDFALYCAQQVQHLSTYPGIGACLKVAAKAVKSPKSVTTKQLRQISKEAWGAVWNTTPSDHAARAAANAVEVNPWPYWAAEAACQVGGSNVRRKIIKKLITMLK